MSAETLWVHVVAKVRKIDGWQLVWSALKDKVASLNHICYSIGSQWRF